jgi:hypothetical protein
MNVPLPSKASYARKTLTINWSLPRFIAATPPLNVPSAIQKPFRCRPLCSVDKNFPLHLWDKLLVPQAKLTLNILRGPSINPKLSAYAQTQGHFDFNRTPIAPPGFRVLVHIKPSERTTWSLHGADGWYIGPALTSYRCYTIWLWDTRATHVCDTLAWFPAKVTMPLASSNDLILAGIGNIVHALRHPSHGSTLAPLTDSLHEALLQLTRVLKTVARPPQPLRVPADVPDSLSSTNVDPPSDTSLRVALLPPSNLPPAAPLPPIPDAPLRVPTPPSTAPSPNRVTFAPLPTTSRSTYDSSTGIIGRSRRRAQRQHHPTTAHNATGKTMHPRKQCAAQQVPPRSVTPHTRHTFQPTTFTPRGAHFSHVPPRRRACTPVAVRQRHRRR